ncbi:DUF3108 domain-containing protein [Ottowia testudinis]|uniref:DUF3108 domain-containing protein n=1 Tax=Ottowia testudinis TaxID=2816950 RepID=A0A975CH89_9BURK|nr:DUF3108 domain-containing protein [Ottowia testudinis]QTD46165.1 DUF3108 domain-containing protein [Ottowia testudinis]
MAAGPKRPRRSARLAGPLTRQRRSLALTTALVVVLHALAMVVLGTLLRPPSLLKNVVAPMYTRSIQPTTPAVPMTAPPTAQPQPNRPTALIRSAQAATKKEATKRPKTTRKPPEDEASGAGASSEPPTDTANTAADVAAPEPQAAASDPPPATTVATASAPAPAPAAESTPGRAVAAAPASGPASAASAADPAFLASWPSDTRLTYKLGGNYRGELHGDARVLWQREGTRYHTAVEMSAGLLASLSFTSQGDITASGLKPEVYEENVRGRRRGVRLGEDVRLNNGTRVPRPDAVQDTASQFVELGHRFATGQVRLAPGAQIDFSMARPGGVDDWTYDVIGEETLHLPRLGPVRALHLKPRPLTKPRGPISAEIWYAPSLQYLPVRIRISQGTDTYIDLVVDTIEQQ